MAQFDLNRIPEEEKRRLQHARIAGHGDSTDPNTGQLLNEVTPGPVGKNQDRGAGQAGNIDVNPSPSCTICIILCLLDVPDGYLKHLYKSYLELKIAAYQAYGQTPQEATETSLYDITKTSKTVFDQVIMPIAQLIVQGKMELTLLAADSPKNPQEKLFEKKVTLYIDKPPLSNFPIIKQKREQLFAKLTKKFGKEVVEQLFKRIAYASNVVGWVITGVDLAVCTGKCTASAVMRTMDELERALDEFTRSVEATKAAWLKIAAQIGKSMKTAVFEYVRTINPANWKFPALFPAEAKQKILTVNYAFSVTALPLQTALENGYLTAADLTMTGNKRLSEMGLTVADLTKVAEGIMEGYYVQGNSNPTPEQREKDRQDMRQKISEMTAYEFAKHLLDIGFLEKIEGDLPE